MRSKTPNRADWADWLYKTHVFAVAEEARSLARKYHANTEVCVAAAMLHDIADAVMTRFDGDHESRSLEIAQDFLTQSEFTTETTLQIITDILPNHSCHKGALPQTLEGKVMASADALVHLESDFYPAAERKIVSEGRPLADFKAWIQEKIDRDYTAKIFFPEEQARVQSRYEALTKHVAAL